MNREEERLTLVTRFESLRQTDLVEVRCDKPGCGRRHRGLLVGRYRGPAIAPDGSSEQTSGWWLFLDPRPAHPGGHVITPCTVARRIVFKVDTGLTQEQETAEKAPAKRPVGVRP